METDDQDPSIDATGPGGIFEPSLGSASVTKPTGDLNPGTVAAFMPWDGSDALMVASYGLPPTPISPRDLNPLLRPLVPVPTIPTDQAAPVPKKVIVGAYQEAEAKKPSPASVVMAITFIKRHFDLVLPPQDSRVQALAELLDLAFDVGASR